VIIQIGGGLHQIYVQKGELESRKISNVYERKKMK